MTQLTENPIEGPLKLQPVRLRCASQTHNSFTVVSISLCSLCRMLHLVSPIPGQGQEHMYSLRIYEHILVTIFQHYQVSCELEVHMRE